MVIERKPSETLTVTNPALKRRGTYASITRTEGSKFVMRTYQSSGRDRGGCVEQGVLQNLFVALDGKAFVGVPLVYGFRTLDRDGEDRRKKTVAWARFRGDLFQVILTYWYAKEGEGFTVNISVSRGTAKGKVWASASFRDEPVLEACIARVVRQNFAQGGKNPPERIITPRREKPEELTEEWTL